MRHFSQLGDTDGCDCGGSQCAGVCSQVPEPQPGGEANLVPPLGPSSILSLMWISWMSCLYKNKTPPDWIFNKKVSLKDQSSCNAFKYYNETLSCEMAQVDTALVMLPEVLTHPTLSWPTWRTRTWALARWRSWPPPRPPPASTCTAGAGTGAAAGRTPGGALLLGWH